MRVWHAHQCPLSARFIHPVREWTEGEEEEEDDMRGVTIGVARYFVRVLNGTIMSGLNGAPARV